MQLSYWKQVVADGYRVPQGAALDDLTLELVTMLGDPDSLVRDDIAYSVLRAWVNEGVYDQLLSGLGDGLVTGLRGGIGEDGSHPGQDSVLRRSFSARVLADVVNRDNSVHALHPAVVLTWADRAVAWLLAERDLRAWIPGTGWAHAMAHGADLLGTLSASRYLGVDELTVLLDVIAERLMAATEHLFTAGEPDRLAFATMSLLHRDLVTAETIESWLGRLRPAWEFDPAYHEDNPTTSSRVNTLAYLRALHLQLVLGVRGTPTQFASSKVITAPAVRADVLLALQQTLRESAPYFSR